MTHKIGHKNSTQEWYTKLAHENSTYEWYTKLAHTIELESVGSYGQYCRTISEMLLIAADAHFFP